MRRVRTTVEIFRKYGFSESVKQAVWREYGGVGVAACYVCGRLAQEIDHVLPKSRGGSNKKSNAAPICCSCNRREMLEWTPLVMGLVRRV